MGKQKSVVRGILAGMAGGLAAAWVMNEFVAGPGQKLQQAVQSDEENREQQAHSSEPSEDATMKAADAIVHTTTGDHLSRAEKEKGGPIVHYAFGALTGGLYGGFWPSIPIRSPLVLAPALVASSSAPRTCSQCPH